MSCKGLVEAELVAAELSIEEVSLIFKRINQAFTLLVATGIHYLSLYQ